MSPYIKQRWTGSRIFKSCQIRILQLMSQSDSEICVIRLNFVFISYLLFYKCPLMFSAMNWKYFTSETWIGPVRIRIGMWCTTNILLSEAVMGSIPLSAAETEVGGGRGVGRCPRGSTHRRPAVSGRRWTPPISLGARRSPWRRRHCASRQRPSNKRQRRLVLCTRDTDCRHVVLKSRQHKFKQYK